MIRYWDEGLKAARESFKGFFYAAQLNAASVRSAIVDILEPTALPLANVTSQSYDRASTFRELYRAYSNAFGIRPGVLGSMYIVLRIT